MSKKVAVVILNWNGKKFLEQFLPSAVKYTTNAEIIVADNNSTDDSITFLQNNYPEIRIIPLEKNYGFTGGYNKALKQVNSEYYLLLNSDIEVTENWLNPMVELLDNNPSVAACQPKLLSYNNKTHFEYAGASGGFIDKYGYPFCRGRIFESLEEDKGQYNDVTQVFWASGACFLIRAELYQNIGGLDDFFFAHMEEIDLCWRLKNQGHKIMVQPSSIVYHVGGGTLNKIKPQKTFLNFRNSLLTLHKNLPKKGRNRIIFTRLCLDSVSGVNFFIIGKPNHTWAIIRSHFSFYGAIAQNRAKRKQHKNPNLYGMINKSIVASYFLRKYKTFNTFLTQLNQP